MPTETCSQCQRTYTFMNADVQHLSDIEEAICAKEDMDFTDMIKVTCPHCKTSSLIQAPPGINLPKRGYSEATKQLSTSTEPLCTESAEVQGRTESPTTP